MTEKGQKTRAEILRAYNDLVYEEGIKTVTVKKIAQKAGISVGNLNYYFKKKSDITDALVGDLFAKTSIILKKCIHVELSGLDKVLLDVFTIILLHHRITPLKNIAFEATADPSVIETSSNFVSSIFIKRFSEEGIQTDKKTTILAIQSSIMAFFFALKLKPSYTTQNFLTLTFGVFFSILGLPAKPYIERAIEIKDMIDEDYLIEQIYNLQDYDYEIRE